jgi:hypothetical protein
MATAVVPVAGVFSTTRAFHVRDLGLEFWGRFLWFRRSLLSGQWPLWDPYVGGGQSAVADATHQMFLLPVVVLRLVGTEIVGFNLWVALPFPLAALGAYLFLAGWFSRPAAALGAVVFAVCGPVISTGNMPNLSWSVAAIPWVLRAADRLMLRRTRAAVALLSATFAFQALAGEPVTLVATGIVATLYAACVGGPSPDHGRVARMRRTMVVGLGLALGLGMACIQLVPLASAVRDSWRPFGNARDFWALHPLGVAEIFSPHLFGDRFATYDYSNVPWMSPLNSGRDPFFYSVYFGVALVALALFGSLAGARRSWARFWSVTIVLALLAAFGPHTPIHGLAQAHLPLVRSFRYPVKYLLMMALALAGLVAAGWDALTGSRRAVLSRWRCRAAWVCPVSFAVALGLVAGIASGACLYAPQTAARRFFALASFVGVADPVEGAAFMLRALPESASRALLLSLGGALFLAVALTNRREARFARIALYGLIPVELVVAAWDINPTFDADYYRQPGWVSWVRHDKQSRFYIGGKLGGNYVTADMDSPRQSLLPADVSTSDGHSVTGMEMVFAPEAWGVREILSYDLATLWPRRYDVVAGIYGKSDRTHREKFLWRTGVRYRVLPIGAGGARPSVPLRYMRDVRLYDWGPVARRVSVVPTAVISADLRTQVASLFDETFDAEHIVLLAESAPTAWGRRGAPQPASGRVVSETANRVVVTATVPAGGGYLLVLDSYAPGWRVAVDGSTASIVRANALFRAVRLVPGSHLVVFTYLPLPFLAGTGISLASLAAASLMLLAGFRRSAVQMMAGTSVAGEADRRTQ